MAASAPAVALNGVKVGTISQAYLESRAVKETKALVSELCRKFYSPGWVSGTGGSITIKVHDDSIPKSQQLIIMSPSGVQKERMEPEDMYIISPNGSTLFAPSAKPYPHKPPKCSDCGPLFMKAYEMRGAGAVIHSHGMESCLVTMINPLSKEFRIEAYPKTTAVLVRNHGIYVWGDSRISAKTQLHQLGLDWTTPEHGPIRSVKNVIRSGFRSNVSAKAQKTDRDIEPFPRCIVLDIEGTTTPISFVSEVLFPYARGNVGRHLSATYDTTDTQDDIKLLRSQVQSDLEQGVAGAVPIPPDDAGKEEVIAALVANVEAMIKADRKITALKQLQGHIWRTGFENNELEGAVFDDVPEALEKWSALGIKVYIYSSGSRLAQRLIFGKTNYGDLRKYLSGFFDTIVGNKKETRSYVEISESLGVDKPSDILFVTDVVQEATAAKAAGLEVLISIRPGNGPLPENHGFKTINSFAEI
ncbi:hypothetical protein L6164_022600 [Bauhinia variegata]|uniref:Uncharacterized protein n=1 Tax=Bauhinia variegata TaxID=167791 RepID=A0ACB9MJ19_BAUVA|nr:hypothetical protein L6164_022600 [Bauhinia variegata]